MIVVIAGMFRSGSTFTFNIARELLHGDIRTLSTNSVSTDDMDWAANKHLVIKSHGPDNQIIEMIRSGQAKCIITYRLPEEAVASWIDTFGGTFEDALNVVKGWLEWHQHFDAPALYIPYECIEAHPRRGILRLQHYIQGRTDRPHARQLIARYSKAAVKTKFDALQEGPTTVNIGFSYFDPVTFFHRKHVTMLGRRSPSLTLSLEQIEAVQAQLGAPYSSMLNRLTTLHALN
jgi:hypothetical protein